LRRHFGRALSRPHELDRMPAAHEAAHDVAQRHRNAIDFRRIGLCYDGDAQRPRSCGERSEVACSVHDARIMRRQC
jgi:hypothetical protein